MVATWESRRVTVWMRHVLLAFASSLRRRSTTSCNTTLPARRRRRARRPSCALPARALAAALIPARHRANTNPAPHRIQIPDSDPECHLPATQPTSCTGRVCSRTNTVASSRPRPQLTLSSAGPPFPNDTTVGWRPQSQQSSRRACDHEGPQQSAVFAIAYAGADECPANTVALRGK